MNPRERFRQTLTFGNPDKVPLEPGGPRESTLAVWRQQGLPANADHREVLMDILGIDTEPSQPKVDHGVSFKMIPEFEEKVLEHREGHYVVQDWMGAVTEISDEFDYTYIRSAIDFVTRKWHKFPVENREDWEAMKLRYDPASSDRFPEDFDGRGDLLRDRDYVVGVHFNGPFWQLREWLGFENLCEMTLTQAEFIIEMVTFWTEFVSRTLSALSARVEPDYVMIHEDMAYKGHSMISPAMVRQFLVPAYQQWVPQIRKSGCPVINLDSDGFVGELIPLWIENDIHCCVPIEVAAGNDIVEFRNTYGREMAYAGGIDKRAMAEGGTVMEEEVLRVVPPLLKDGGFIPGCDHGVPPDISWPNFIDYTRLLAQLTGWL